MRHLQKGRKFGRVKNQRKALMKSLATSFFLLGKIKTTEAKAKELRPFVEKFITRGKIQSLANRRILIGHFAEKVVKKIFEYGKNYEGRRGGYTRIIRIGVRKGDASHMAFLELVK